MKKIEATIAPYKLEEVRDALVELGLEGMSISEVQGFDPCARPAWYRGSQYVRWFAPQIRIELVVSSGQVAECVAVIERSARTDDGQGGDVVVLPVEDAVRIRTGERLARAVRGDRSRIDGHLRLAARG
jgi:nitrogen regulatory protein P-II 1